jgi:hypothetical protein
MANTIAGVNPTRIAQLTLQSLKAQLIPFSAFTTNFSNEIAVSGDAVTTRYVTNPVTQDFNANKNVGNNTLTARTITLYHYVGVSLGFTDRENSLSDIQLAQQFIDPAINSLCQNVFTNVASLILNASFSNVVYTAAQFSAANVANIAGQMTTANVSLVNRHLVIKPTYALTLKTDSGVQASYAYGNNQAVSTGRVPDVFGFQVHESGLSIPTNSENLEGWACTPQALLLAARVPALPRNWAGQVMNVTEPDSGLTVQYRDWYDGTTQRTEVCMIYGAQIGVTGNLLAIRKANS